VTKDRVECAWQHELPECCCIAVDAEVPAVGSYSRVSLFRVEIEHAKKGKGKGKAASKSVDRDSAGAGSSSESAAPNYSYLIDYMSSGDMEPAVHPLAVAPGVSLTSLKIVGGDTVLVGGTRGYVGVCEYGSSEVASRQFEGHPEDAAVSSMAACAKRRLAVCGDDGGGLSLWLCTGGEERVQCGSVLGGEVCGHAAVNCLQFVPDRNLVAVSTRSKYILLGLPMSADTGRYELEGIAEINVNSLFSSMGPGVSPVKSMPSFGADSNSDIFQCHCLAFPRHGDGPRPLAGARHDFGGLKSHTLTPPSAAASAGEEASASAGGCSWPVVVWRVSGVSPQAGMWLCTCTCSNKHILLIITYITITYYFYLYLQGLPLGRRQCGESNAIMTGLIQQRRK
jgi:hypothetical protein